MEENELKNGELPINESLISYNFFPNEPEELEYVITIYENEIVNRSKWINESVVKIDEAYRLAESSKRSMASSIINNAMSIINHAMLVLRLVDEKAIGARNVKRSSERARILNIRNPEFPEPPKSLRAIRNDYEHFEERLDEWACKKSFKHFVDLSVSDSKEISNFNSNDVFRNLNNDMLTFWNKEIELPQVVKWVDKMSMVVSKNRYL